MLAAAAALVAVAAAGCASIAEGPADPSAGKVLFEARCSACHALPHPQDYAPAEWRPIVIRYGREAGMSPEEKRDVLGWLQEEAAR